MKKQLILIIASLGFSSLFYQQGFGLNMVLFAILSVILVSYFRPEALRRREYWMLALAYIVSATFVFFHNSPLSIVNTFISFLIFVGSISGIRNSVYVQWFNGLYQTFVGSLHQRIHTKTAPAAKKRIHHSYDFKFILLTAIIVGGLVTIFSALYGQANPIFEKGLAAIDLSFINMSWLLFSAMGYLLLNNITAVAELDVMTVSERNIPTQLQPNTLSEKQQLVVQKENRLGVVVMVTLNLLILLFICTDLIYVFQSPLDNGTVLSKTIHDGVNALIMSIVIAIILILVLFRGDLNFYKYNQNLKTLTFLWIGLNVIIILITSYKNFLYSSGFGLTYKRIGVFIYLLLCISGMITTYIKVARQCGLYYMLRTNASVAFTVLMVMASFSWDRTITQFNLEQVAQPDMDYLYNMSYRNGPLLHAFAKAHPSKNIHQNKINERYERWERKLSNETWQTKTIHGLLHKTSYEKSKISH
jgi:hypothetical protein